MNQLQAEQLQFMDAMGMDRFLYVQVGYYDALTASEMVRAIKLAKDLINEEVNKELLPALDQYMLDGQPKTLVEVADGLVDAVYVLMQLANTLGLPFQKLWDEVQRSNMAKRGPDGKITKRSDGKVLKPEGWTPPDLRAVLFR